MGKAWCSGVHAILLTVIITETAPLHQVRSYIHSFSYQILLSSCPILAASKQSFTGSCYPLNATQPPSMISSCAKSLQVATAACQ